MSLNIEKFTAHLRENAQPGFGTGLCATFVRQALEAAGADIPSHPALAKAWGPTLLRIGFHTIKVEKPDIFHFMTGDVMVMEPYKNGNPASHIAGFDGRNWISDFIQRDFWGGPGYRKERPGYVVYRR